MQLEKWLTEARENASEEMVIMLIGNKVDLEHKYVPFCSMQSLSPVTCNLLKCMSVLLDDV